MSAFCTYDAAADSGSIPSAGVLDPMLSYGTGTINVAPAEVETVTAGDYAVKLTLGDASVEYATVTFTN